ncbi:hypothetical protein ACQ33O_07005 [Ferruginibacter sp. SUN002]|uniref:hypothetical protein n=1 Tax=Ferruginibacter sp. SUN002 TaxID=2937789 RepID=UPI003D35BE89
MSIDKFHRIILVIALAVYCITAYNSHGYIQEDEHYQIIEFAQLKLGLTQPQQLPWEFHQQMRSAFQPGIAYTIFSICKLFSTTDPYILAFILRFLTALLAISIITQFVRSTLNLIEERYQKVYIAASYLFWFLPFINVRFSSEAWSGIFFLLAIAIALRNRPQYVLTGIFLGISFLCRFQSAILSISLFIWLALIKKESATNILKIFSGAVIIFLLGIMIDRWFYGNFTFTSWNYFYNTILDDTTKDFGHSKLYAYIKVILVRPSILIGLPLIFSLLILFIKDRRNLFLWIAVPFIIIHSFIPHKEYRFLFPLMNFIPIIIIMGIQLLKIKQSRTVSIIVNTILIISFMANAIILIGVATRAADGRVAISKYLHKNYSDKPIKVFYTYWSDYFTPEIPANFYKEKNVELVRVSSIQDITTAPADTTKINFVVLRKNGMDSYIESDQLTKLGYKKEMQSLPVWIEKWGIPTKLVFKNEILELYQKK